MPRIRSIKPELPQSESMGNITRDARLCFILLFTLSDDHGKLRGSSRMLASLLYPYDDDAPKHIERWLGQLEKEGCIIRYEVEGVQYIKIVKWDQHQKVDKPSRSKIPDPPEQLARIREDSRTIVAGSEDQRIEGSEDQGKDREGDAAAAAPSPRATRLPVDWGLPQPWGEWAQAQGMAYESIIRQADIFRDYWHGKSGKDATKTDWQATWRNWIRRYLTEYAK